MAELAGERSLFPPKSSPAIFDSRRLPDNADAWAVRPQSFAV
jgi:hypothetical protein